MNDTVTKGHTPIWLWIAGGLGLIWSIGGLYPLFEALGELPIWLILLFAINVLAGIIGCIALLMRKRLSAPALLASLIAIVAYIVAAYAAGVMGSEGGPQIAIVGSVAFVSLVLWATARFAISKGLLNA